MKKRQILSFVLISLISLSLTISCSNPQSNTSNTTPTETAPNQETISIGFSAWPGWFPWQITQDEKIFDSNNVNVDLKWFDGYLDSINAFNASQLDGNSQTLNDTISSVAAGADQVIVLVNDNSTGNDQIIVSEGINTIADLKGKTVAVEEGTVDHFLLLLGLQKEGLSPKDVEIKPLETGAAAAAFVAGQVDAVGVFAPFTTQALQRPNSKALFTSADFPGAIPDHLVVTKALIDSQPETVQALVNSWFATLDYIKANPDKSLEILAKRANVTVDEYKDYDQGTTIFSIEDNLTAFTPGTDMKSLSFAAQEISKFLLDSGLIQQQPDLTKIFDDRFVKAYANKSKTP